MPDRRRSSLIDQMAMAAALENISDADSSAIEEEDVEGVEGQYGATPGATEGGEESVYLEDDEITTEMVFNSALEETTHYSVDESRDLESQPLNDQDSEQVDSYILDNTSAAQGSDFPSIPEDGGTSTSSLRGRRSSRASQITFTSAPERRQRDNVEAVAARMSESLSGIEAASSSENQRHRPLSISVPNTQNAVNSRSTSSSLLGFGRRSGRRSPQGSLGSLDDAMKRLRKRNSSSEWESVAAAQAVVQESGRLRPNIRSNRNPFLEGEYVLVFLTLLNVTNEEDPKDTFTVAAVNKYGFPEGEGRNEQEKSGPYNFVLARIKSLHFEEDDRYYTVIRADTGSEQRADSGWMEPLNDPVGITAAAKAAKTTFRSVSDKEVEMMDDSGYIQDAIGRLWDAISWPSKFFHDSFLPWYHEGRAASKLRIAQVLYGDTPFSCKIRITGVNFLVICSLVFLFLEVTNLAFFPSGYDKEVTIVGIFVWTVLFIELILETLIRPSNYSALMTSDKAFAPSTARHISTFHLFFEGIALATFIPEFRCGLDEAHCSQNTNFSKISGSLHAIVGPTRMDIALGRLSLGITALRFFGVVRHWKQMFISKTFRRSEREEIENDTFLTSKDLKASDLSIRQTVLLKTREMRKRKKEDDNDSYHGPKGEDLPGQIKGSEEDQRLKNAATIGTALMVVNSQRALMLLAVIILVVPLLFTITGPNLVAIELVKLLQANNIEASSNEDCAYLEAAVDSFLKLAMVPQPPSLMHSEDDTFVLWAQILPKRCDWQREDGVITYCVKDSHLYESDPSTCNLWNNTLTSLDGNDFQHLSADDMSTEFARELQLRKGGIQSVCMEGRRISECGTLERADVLSPEYNVTVFYNENPTISLVNMGMFFLLLGNLIVGLYSLQALRGDAIRLVLDPLQRMLKIVLRYAENPLSQNAKGSSKRDDALNAVVRDTEEIGNYETEQLIIAITKIADLLRKCWGVAGAGIISSNLARTVDGKTVVFNPTVPGKRVYALFGFVAINGFSDQLRRLDRDVMILINDVAKVVHDEVYRWALGDHGQCNKNLGAAFLMVFRIGDFSEVYKKKQAATEKLFRSNKGNKANAGKLSKLRQRKRNGNLKGTRRGSISRQTDAEAQINLASLPGIHGFTDRALLGMLKSFAGIHRDKNLLAWQNDFRLSDGVGNFSVDIIYGMDAGWAVEGAVGSEYKIDATYLSPHVNMASRMMSATKQYGVTILLSKAVEELLSRNCRKKLRHLDTVYVKGSNVKQNIFTYDARHQGVDFFLIERTPIQADIDAESYTPNIWDNDQDLKAMRQHVSEEFMELYRLGVKYYLAGDWQEAYSYLEKADNKMIEKILDEGYIEIDFDEYSGDIFDRNDQSEDVVRLRQDLGDGGCRVLMSFMKGKNLVAPLDWDGVRKLSSK